MSVRVGIVGLGGIAHRHAVGEIEIVGVCDPSEDARAAAGKLGVAPTFPKFDELLERTSHFEICWRAMRAGAHVFCEKPFVLEIEQTDRLIEFAHRETKESINAQIPRARTGETVHLQPVFAAQ